MGTWYTVYRWSKLASWEIQRFFPEKSGAVEHHVKTQKTCCKHGKNTAFLQDLIFLILGTTYRIPFLV